MGIEAKLERVRIHDSGSISATYKKMRTELNAMKSIELKTNYIDQMKEFVKPENPIEQVLGTKFIRQLNVI